MQDILDRISKLTGIQKLGAAVVVYVLVALALLFLLIRPTSQKIETAQSQHTRLQTEVEEKRAIANDRDRWEEQVEQLNESLARAVKELPNDREIPELLRRISTIGKKIGLEFLLFQPVPELKRDFYADVPVKLKIEGSYHEVATFFDRIGKLNRIVNIRDIQMGDPIERSGRMVLTIEGTAVTYRFLSDKETAPPGRAAPPKRRRRSSGGGH